MKNFAKFQRQKRNGFVLLLL